MPRLVLDNTEEVTVEGNYLEIVRQSERRIQIRAGDEFFPPPPPPAGDNFIHNGRFIIDGKYTLEGWEQDKGWYDTHRALPEDWGADPNVGFLQGDRDYKGKDLWPPDNPSTASIWYDTFGELPEHSQLNFHFVEIHHQHSGKDSVTISVLGRNEGDWVELYTTNLLSDITGKDSPPMAREAVIRLPNGSYGEYRVNVIGTLSVKNDGFLLGDFVLVGE